MLGHYNVSSNGTYLLAIQRRLVSYLLLILETLYLCPIYEVPFIIQPTYIIFL